MHREDKKHIYLNNIPMKHITTRKEYDELTRDKLLGKEECPFCDRETQSDHIVWKGNYWYILRNLFPYSGDERHLMAVPYTHKLFSYELIDEELQELHDIHLFMKDFYGDSNYFSSTRETIGNRSVEHIHMHFIPGTLKWVFLRKMLELQWFPIRENLIL